MERERIAQRMLKNTTACQLYDRLGAQAAGKHRTDEPQERRKDRSFGEEGRDL